MEGGGEDGVGEERGGGGKGREGKGRGGEGGMEEGEGGKGGKERSEGKGRVALISRVVDHHLMAITISSGGREET